MAKHASEFPRIRDVCLHGAQFYHRVQVSLGPGNIKFRDVVPLRPEAALQLGCEFVSETVVFGIAFAFLFYEYEQSQAKEAAKEAKRAQTVAEMKAEIAELRVRNGCVGLMTCFARICAELTVSHAHSHHSIVSTSLRLYRRHRLVLEPLLTYRPRHDEGGVLCVHNE